MPSHPTDPSQGDPQRVEALFDQALDLDPADREAFLEDACGGDLELRRYVRQLLVSSSAAESNPGWGESAAMKVARASADAAEPALERYRLLERIGVGGMGVVYKAVRSDDAYSKEVAIKIVQWATGDDNIVRRFRTERQILANLEHPNIARLLDGGETEDGSPFLVMEFIQGIPIDDYVRQRKPALRTLLELFRRICAAAGYAHRNLVVHRDLKPGNILVTDGPDGIPEPKLLDFGIARLLDDSGEGSHTRTRTMTIEYASPEQVSGAPIGTASDIYSLGVLLYELVTGSRPYRPTTSQMDLAEVICREVPLPLKASIDPDLTNIILMALRKEPGRRYESAEQFSEDLRRFLEGYPVMARPDTRGYRLRKFLGRNMLPIAAALIILLTLAGGVIATIRQARIAGRRFDEVRKLAHSVLFDYHDAIAQLPGSVPVRKMLVKDGLAYLDGLSKEAGGDAGLQLEMAGAYLKVGDIQAQPLHANLGDVPGGLNSYGKSLQLLEALQRANPSSEEVQEELAVVWKHYGELNQDAGKPVIAVANLKNAMAILERLCATGNFRSRLQLFTGEYGGTRDRRAWLADTYSTMGVAVGSPTDASLGDTRQAVAWYRKALALNETLAPNVDILLSMGAIHSNLGGILTNEGKNADALTEYKKTLDIELQRKAMGADTVVDRREIAIAYHNVAVGMLGTKEYPAALENFQAAQGLLDALAAADPADWNIRITVADNTRRTAETLYHLDDYANSVKMYREAIRQYVLLSAHDPRNSSLRIREGIAYLAMSLEYDHTKDGAATTEAASHSQTIFLEPILSGNPSAVQLRARAVYEAGNGYAIRGNWSAARESYKKSVDLWHEIKAQGQLPGNSASRVAEAEKGLAESEKHLSH